MSLDILEVFMAVEDAFGFKIPDEQYESLQTVGQLCEYIHKRISKSDPDVILQTVQKIVCEQCMMPIDDIKPESRWFADLGLG